MIRASSSTTPTPTIRPMRSRCHDCRRMTFATRRWGSYRDVTRPTYDGLMAAQLDHALTKDAADTAALDALLHGKDTWTIA